MDKFKKLSIRPYLLTINSIAVRILPTPLKERLKSTTLGNTFRNYLRKQ